MKHAIPVNLASEPFRRHRPILLASALAGILMAAVLAMLVSLILIERDEVAETAAAIDRLEARVRQLAAEEAQLQAVLNRPENAEVLDRSVFLNLLLTRKGISWTRIFGDLEEVLPHNVKLISVRPQVDGNNRVQLDMVVASQSTEHVVQLLMKLEASPQFGATAVTNWLPPSQSEPLFRYRVSVNYAQEL